MTPRQRLSPPPPEDRSLSPVLPRKTVEREDSGASTSVEADSSRDRHDLFNLVALLPIIFLTILNWDWRKIQSGHGLEESWTGDLFIEYWFATQLYFVVDLLWVANVPTCVKSPDTIIKHHFIAIFYLTAPLIWPQYRWFMGACLSVEINTWFLIARRAAYKRSDAVSQQITELISVCFYGSWILIRCIIYPGILMVFLSMARDIVIDTGTCLHWPIIFLPVHGFLCILNLKWTYDLFHPIIKKWWIHQEYANVGISSGL